MAQPTLLPQLLDRRTRLKDRGSQLGHLFFLAARLMKPCGRRPRFVEMVSMLVSFSLDKERMRTTVTWLGFRHVRYGVRPHHIPIMGQAMPPSSPPAPSALRSRNTSFSFYPSATCTYPSATCTEIFRLKALTRMHMVDTGVDGSARASAERPVDGGDGDCLGRIVAGAVFRALCWPL